MKIVLEYVFTTKKWCLKTEFRKIEKSKEYDTLLGNNLLGASNA